jgi:hypothetical protein
MQAIYRYVTIIRFCSITWCQGWSVLGNWLQLLCTARVCWFVCNNYAKLTTAWLAACGLNAKVHILYCLANRDYSNCKLA